MSDHKTTIRVIYGDTDNMGQAYYGNYFRWFEIGRNEMFRSLGLPYKSVEERGIFLPVAEAHCKYCVAAQYDDVLVIETSVKYLQIVPLSYAAYGMVMVANASFNGLSKPLPLNTADEAVGVHIDVIEDKRRGIGRANAMLVLRLGRTEPLCAFLHYKPGRATRSKR